MKVGFLNNQIDGRGTGNAVYNYAKYNEEILGNKSKILTFPSPNHDEEAVHKFLRRFGEMYPYQPEHLTDLDVLYHIKSGRPDGTVVPKGLPYAVHAVFDSQPHGDRYAVVSEWMGLRDEVDFVPHIVKSPVDRTTNLRNYLKIPNDAIVFGRIGGYDSFDMPDVWEVIRDVLDQSDNTYFLFVNTAPANFKHERLIFLAPTLDEPTKETFFNTCNAMLHARMRGETFGISVAEFAIRGKPIFTYKHSYEKAHIFELRGTAITYEDKEDLFLKLMAYDGKSAKAFYTKYTPEKVMAKFENVFLNDSE